MKSIDVPLPIMGAVAATRGMLGFGAGLLAAPSIPDRQRKAFGWALLAIGVLSTIPLAFDIVSRIRDGGSRFTPQ